MLSLPSPAKINWFLHINRKREDGYHDLETCFQFLSLCDQMHFERLDTSEIVIEGMPDVPLEKNLIYRAATAMMSFGSFGIKISIDKTIPMGGGLGGGSSNAATTLVAINKLCNFGLTTEQLMEIARPLGADVPVFIHGQGCFAQGIGDHCHSLDLPNRWLLLLIPDCQVSTQKLFQHPELTTNTPPCKIGTLNAPMELSLRPQGFKNDFEPLVRKLYNPVAEALDWLGQYSTAHLSGTGCCVFAPFANEQEARTTANKLPSTMRGLVVQSLNHSPLWSAA